MKTGRTANGDKHARERSSDAGSLTRSNGRSSVPESRLDKTFRRLKTEGRKALITYLMAGDPNLEQTEQLVLELEKAGADIIELGVPFSDPIADGPVIQQAAERALRSGTTLRAILLTVQRLRTRSEVPLVFMAYYNSIHAFGPERFCREAAEAGVDGLIVPDMPPDEAGPLQGPAAAAGLQLIFLLAPTSTAERRAYVARRSHGFVYYVSLTGITGAKLGKVSEIGRNVEQIRKVSQTPIAVGFGVTTPEDAADVAAVADAVIVGSAVVKQIAAGQQQQGMAARVAGFVKSLKSAMASRPV